MADSSQPTLPPLVQKLLEMGFILLAAYVAAKYGITLPPPVPVPQPTPMVVVVGGSPTSPVPVAVGK